LEHFKLIITLVDRGKGGKAVDLYRNHHLHFDFACLGAGTASSKILNYFGLDETLKELVWTLAPESRIPRLLGKVRRVLDLDTPGKGILFTIPLTGISAQIPLCSSSRNTKKRRNPLWKRRTPSPRAIPTS
jgi:hypothetical protein